MRTSHTSRDQGVVAWASCRRPPNRSSTRARYRSVPRLQMTSGDTVAIVRELESSLPPLSATTITTWPLPSMLQRGPAVHQHVDEHSRTPGLRPRQMCVYYAVRIYAVCMFT